MIDIGYTPGPLLDATRNISTAFWNDFPDLDELRQSTLYGGVGATCNLAIVYITIKEHPDVWASYIQAIADANPIWGESKIGWKATKDMSQEAAGLLKPIFSRHKECNGRLSVQTDPCFHYGAKKLADQAEKFHSLAHNTTMKIPVIRTGLEAIEDATSRGVSINIAMSFSVPQAAQAVETIEYGLKACEAAGHDTPEMGPVVTIMAGRFNDWLKRVVARDGIFIDPSALKWAGIAVMKHVCQIFQECGYYAHMPVAAFRNINQWAEFAGNDIVVFLLFKRQKIITDPGYIAREYVIDPVDPHYIAELECIPDFVRAYEPGGVIVEELGEFGPTRKTLCQFLATGTDLDAPVHDIIALIS